VPNWELEGPVRKEEEMDGSFAAGPLRKERGFIKRHLKAFMVGALIASFTAGGIGYALWSINGSGSAYSKATSSQALTTVDVSAQAPGQLYPGGSGDMVIKIHNPNAFPVTVTDVTFGAVSPSTCFVTADDQTGLSISVAAGGDSALTTFPGAAHMGSGAGDACQGQLFTIAATLAGTQN
jgi:hypothetical protein